MNYFQQIADEIRDEVPSGLLPEGDSHALFLFYALLVTSKGVEVSCEDVHNAWTGWMSLAGSTHASMVPFSELTTSTQQEDQPYRDAIRRVAQRHS